MNEQIDKSDSKVEELTQRGGSSELALIMKGIFGGVEYIVRDNLGELKTSPDYNNSKYIASVKEIRLNPIASKVHFVSTYIDGVKARLQTNYQGVRNELQKDLKASQVENITNDIEDAANDKNRPFFAGNIKIHYENGNVEIPMILTGQQYREIHYLYKGLKVTVWDKDIQEFRRSNDSQDQSFTLQAARLARAATLNNLKNMRDFAEKRSEIDLATQLGHAFIRLSEAQDFNISLAFKNDRKPAKVEVKEIEQ